MNIYSFKRISSGVNKGYYFHPFFQRSDISLAHQILRKKQKSELTASAWLALKEVSVGGVPRSCFISSMNDGVGLLPTSTKNENKIQLGLDQFSAQPTMRASIFDHALLSSETRVEDEESFGADFTMRNVDMKQEDIKHISFLFSRAGDRQSSLFNPNDIEAGGDLALVTLPHSHCGMSTLCHAAKFENDEWGDVINKLLRDVERSRTMMTATVLILLMTCQI